MNKYFKSIILKSTRASSLVEKEVIQTLWSGYGKIMRIGLEKGVADHIVIKHVQWPVEYNHPRGWNTEIGHRRKVKSYQVESHWYKTYSQLSKARLPLCYAVEKQDDEVLIVLEDLDESGFTLRKSYVTWDEVATCLEWLANFHSTYLGRNPAGLWEVGSYWHLETRPHELSVLNDQRLKAAAAAIDLKLNACRFQTLVHGDAKLANFCFSPEGSVAAVDFQYVGGGCGMKDVAYFVGSCLDEEACETLESRILDTYFSFLHKALGEKNEAMEEEWRALYHIAWADFHRFLKGWSPGHWKVNSYSERILTKVINNL